MCAFRLLYNLASHFTLLTRNGMPRRCKRYVPIIAHIIPSFDVDVVFSQVAGSEPIPNYGVCSVSG